MGTHWGSLGKHSNTPGYTLGYSGEAHGYSGVLPGVSTLGCRSSIPLRTAPCARPRCTIGCNAACCLVSAARGCVHDARCNCCTCCTCCTLHVARCNVMCYMMLPAARCMLHAARCMFHAARCMLRVACFQLLSHAVRLACRLLHLAFRNYMLQGCMVCLLLLHVAMLRVECCLNARCTPHAASRPRCVFVATAAGVAGLQCRLLQWFRCRTCRSVHVARFLLHVVYLHVACGLVPVAGLACCVAHAPRYMLSLARFTLLLHALRVLCCFMLHAVLLMHAVCQLHFVPFARC
jgi:hypothetical protein